MTNTRVVMTASAAFMAAAGLGASFLPQEILSSLGGPPNGPITMLIQIGGALYLAMAMVNWMGSQSLIGGIYNRPVAMGNFVHFFIGVIVLANGLLAGQAAAWVWAGCGLYAIFTLGFGLVAFGSPVKPAPVP